VYRKYECCWGLGVTEEGRKWAGAGALTFGAAVFLGTLYEILGTPLIATWQIPESLVLIVAVSFAAFLMVRLRSARLAVGAIGCGVLVGIIAIYSGVLRRLGEWRWVARCTASEPRACLIASSWAGDSHRARELVWRGCTLGDAVACFQLAERDRGDTMAACEVGLRNCAAERDASGESTGCRALMRRCVMR
jgi:hypothetical protein